MTFFDYPGSEDSPGSATATEIFLPDASDRDWAVLLGHCRRRRFDTGQTVIEAAQDRDPSTWLWTGRSKYWHPYREEGRTGTDRSQQ